MASAKVSLVFPTDGPTETTEMIIVGGGICGILAAKKCHDLNIPYKLIEREDKLGGNWHILANAHSYLQAFEPNYRWDNKYRLNQDPLTKNSAKTVLATLKRYATDFNVPQNTYFNTEAITVTEEKAGIYRMTVKDLATGQLRQILGHFLCVTCGILSTQHSATDRGIKNLDAFGGIVTYGGRHEGTDSAIASTDLTGKHVVILGSGSFAAEALEAADRSHAELITVIGRPRYRWILPFSRQYTVTAMANAPLIPWSWKSKLALFYLRKQFYEPCKLTHWMPSGGPEKMDYSGQCNDGYFRLSWQGRLECRLDGIKKMNAREAVLKSGERIPCDMLVVASGCKYNLDPPFLRELGIGFKDLHNFAFLGNNPRIGCASDFVFAYVPFGPIKQLEMYFHAVQCCRNGKEEEIRAALKPTPLPNHGEGMHKGGRMAGHYTFFEYEHWWSTLSKAQEARVDSMFRTLDVGRSLWGRILLRVAAAASNYIGWLGTLCLACKELWRYPVYGPGVGDHHHRPVKCACDENGCAVCGRDKKKE